MDTGPAELLRASPTDAAELADLRGQFWRDQQAKGLLDPIPDLAVATVESLISRARTSIFLARQDGVALGYVFGQTKLVPGSPPQKVSSIEEIFIAPGQRRGALAAQLFESALEDFKLQQTDRIQLRVLSGNDEGHRFWERLGFRPNVTLYELDFH